MIYSDTKLRETCLDYPITAQPEETVEWCKRAIEIINSRFGDEPIYLACTGTSGACLALIIAINRPGSIVMQVKKPKENCHRALISTKDQYKKSPHPIVIVDDHAASGDTVDHIINTLERYEEIIRFPLAIFQHVGYHAAASLDKIDEVVAGSPNELYKAEEYQKIEEEF